MSCILRYEYSIISFISFVNMILNILEARTKTFVDIYPLSIDGFYIPLQINIGARRVIAMKAVALGLQIECGHLCIG